MASKQKKPAVQGGKVSQLALKRRKGKVIGTKKQIESLFVEADTVLDQSDPRNDDGAKEKLSFLLFSLDNAVLLHLTRRVSWWRKALILNSQRVPMKERSMKI